MKKYFALKYAEAHFIDWIMHRGLEGQWFFIFISIPLLILTAVLVCTGAMSLMMMCLGMAV